MFRDHGRRSGNNMARQQRLSAIRRFSRQDATNAEGSMAINLPNSPSSILLNDLGVLGALARDNNIAQRPHGKGQTINAPDSGGDGRR